MLYGTVQSGYLRGGYDYPGYIDPVKLTSFTAGIKNRFFGRRLTFNLEGFYYDYEDLQVVLTDATGLSVAYNVPKSEIYGVEAKASFQIGGNTFIDTGLTWLGRANYKDFGPGVTGIDLTGLRLMRAPQLTANFNIEQRIPLGEFVLAAMQNYFSSSYWTVFDHGQLSPTTAGLVQGSYWKGDATLTLSPPDNRWSIGAFVRNIANRAVYQSALSGTPNHSQLAPPRTYGLRIGFDF